MDLSTSKWAPTNCARSRPVPASSNRARGTRSLATSTENTSHGPTTSLRLEGLQRYDLLLQRLKWKSSLLYSSHQRLHEPGAVSAPSFLSDGQAWDDVAAEAMFKVDFFEFFMLLERVLVHLLNSLDISIAKYASTTNSNINSAGTNPSAPIFGTSGRFPVHNHRFHANVLQALENSSNPVHELLGTGEVRRYLSIAKDCRNRWKNVENSLTPSATNNETSFHKVLATLDLGRMLYCIIEALDLSRTVAARYVLEPQSNGTGRLNNTNGTTSAPTSNAFMMDIMEYDLHETPWEAMPDAMDWDEMI